MSSHSNSNNTTDDVVASEPVAIHMSPSQDSLPYSSMAPNPWSRELPTYSFGVADEKGARRTMEDAHSYVVDYAGIRGQGFFAIFDGHAGKEAAEWCGRNFHERMIKIMRENPTSSIPDVYNLTFHNVDLSLSKISEESEGKIHSGCTAVTAFLRIEDADGGQSFLASSAESSTPPADSSSSTPEVDLEGTVNTSRNDDGNGGKGNKLKKALGRLSHPSASPPSTPRSQSPSHISKDPKGGANNQSSQVPPPGLPLRRVLYVANAGDARGVLCRSGRALRLTYDHKGTDKQEAKRIVDSGGFVMGGRVNGVLAVTRSLGDSSMKDFVVGAPYTTETELTDDDELLILACDGIWDVLDDQTAVDLVRGLQNPQEACDELIRQALQRYTNDNITALVIRFKDVTTNESQ